MSYRDPLGLDQTAVLPSDPFPLSAPSNTVQVERWVPVPPQPPVQGPLTLKQWQFIEGYADLYRVEGLRRSDLPNHGVNLAGEGLDIATGLAASRAFRLAPDLGTGCGGGGGGSRKLFRAVSSEELADIRKVGFRPGPGQMETKLFATSAEDAAAFGRDLYRLDGKPFTLVEVNVPDSLYRQLEQFIADRRPTVAVPMELQGELNRAPLRVWNRTPYRSR